jgi:hypothetical protein
VVGHPVPVQVEVMLKEHVLQRQEQLQYVVLLLLLLPHLPE